MYKHEEEEEEEKKKVQVLLRCMNEDHAVSLGPRALTIASENTFSVALLHATKHDCCLLGAAAASTQPQQWPLQSCSIVTRREQILCQKEAGEADKRKSK
jgi:hypothetical protein